MSRFIRWLFVFLIIFILVWFCIVLITDQDSICQSITESTERCMNVIIPSLFAFMALSGIITASGAYSLISKPLFPLSYITGIPKELLSIFIISNVAGYPVGAKLLCDLYDNDQISSDTAKTMLCFCYGAGPAFICSVAGLALYGSVSVGMVVYIACVLSNLMLACVLCRLKKPKISAVDNRFSFNAQLISDSVISAGKSLFSICLMIVFFSVVVTVLDNCGVTELIASAVPLSDSKSIIKALCEISSITQIDKVPFGYIPIISALCSFGGVCVLLQTSSVIAGRFSIVPLLLTRAVSAALSAVISYWLCGFMLPDNLTAVSTDSHIFVKVNNFIPSVCLILMIFLLKIKKRVAFSS